MESKKYLSLNKKIIIYSLVITLITLFLINYLTVFLINNNIKMEEQLTLQDMSRVYNAINNTIRQMNALNIEYACWDSTKDFINGTYPELADENFMDATFQSNGWNIIILYNNEGLPIYQKSYHLLEEQADKELLKLIKEEAYFSQIKEENDYVSGIVSLNNHPIILTIFPVLSSYKEGPISGFFVTGSYVDDIFIEELVKVTQYKLEISEQVHIKDTKILSAENLNQGFIWTSIEGMDITGYLTLSDINNQPNLTLKYSRPMDFLSSSKKTVHLYVGIIILIFIFNFMGILLLINRLFIKRLNALLKHIKTIILEQDLSTRMDIDANDEFSILGIRFNEMLNEIEDLNNQLLYRAQMDQLTDLPNRHYFYERVNELIQNKKVEKSALLFLDLDKFKEVNDTYGHNVGDEFLKKFAHTVKNVINHNDIICRLGGDEFAIWMNQYNDVEEVENYVKRILDVLKEPVNVFDYQLTSIPSIGISLYPDHGTDIDLLIDNADYAMYQAKNNQNGYAIYREVTIDNHLKNSSGKML